MAETKKTMFMQITERPNQQMQVPLKADMIVPDTKPDIGRVLKSRAYLEIGEKTLDNGRLHWGGQLVCRILYAGEENARELHSMEYVINVDEFMNLELPEGEGRVRYTLNCDVEEVKATILNSRKLGNAVNPLCHAADNPDSISGKQGRKLPCIPFPIMGMISCSHYGSCHFLLRWQFPYYKKSKGRIRHGTQPDRILPVKYAEILNPLLL